MVLDKVKVIILSFIKHSLHEKVTALNIFVEDIVLTRDDLEEIKCLKSYLGKEFKINDLGNLKYFLGIGVARYWEGIFISHRKHVLDLLQKPDMLRSKAVDTPMDPNLKLGEDPNGEPIDKERY